MGNIFSRCFFWKTDRQEEVTPKIDDGDVLSAAASDDIFGAADDIFLDKVLEYVSGLLSFYFRLSAHKPSSFIFWGLPEASTFKGVKHVVEKASDTASQIDPNNAGEAMKVIQTVLSGFGKSHWIAVGLLAIAVVLERLETVSANKKESLVLLQDLHRLGKCVKQIKSRPNLNKGDMKESAEEAMKLVVKGSVFCLQRIKDTKIQGFMHAGAHQSHLAQLKSKVDKTYRDLMLNLGICIYDAASATNSQDRRVNSYPRKAVGIDDQFYEVVDLLELESPKSAVAVLIYGGVGTGKTTLAQAIYAGTQLEPCRYSKISLFEYRGDNPNIVKLQADIVKDLTGETEEFESYNQGQLKIQQILQDTEAFIFIDNVLDSLALQNLLPRNLDRAKRLRLLLTAETDTVVSALAVKERKTKPMRSMAVHDAMEVFKKELTDLRNEQIEMIQNMLKNVSLTPMTVNLVSNVIKEADNKDEAFNTVAEKITEMQGSGESTPEDDNEFPVLNTTPDQVNTNARMMQKFAYDQLSEDAKEAFLDICAFFNDWEWWRVESILGDKEVQELERRGFVIKCDEEEEDMATRVIQRICRVQVPGSFLDMGLDISQGLRFTDVYKLELALLLRRREDKELQDIRGVYLRQGRGMKKGSLTARDLDSVNNSLRILSLCYSLIQIHGDCKRRFDHLIFFEADEMPVPIDIYKQKRLRYLSYWPQHGVDISKMPKTLRFLHLWGLTQAMAFTFGKRLRLEEFVNLQSLILKDAEEIEELPASICKLQALKILNLNGAKYLRSLPSNIGLLTSLEELRLDWCETLATLPDSSENLTSLKILSLNWCYELIELPRGIGSLINLTRLQLKGCLKLSSLPASIRLLENLQLINLKGCINMKSLPDEISELQSLRILYFWDGKLLKSLPRNFRKLVSLLELELNGCEELERLPNGFGQLKSLERLELCDCNNLKELSSDFYNLQKLQYLDLTNCTKLENVEMSQLVQMPTLKRLYIVGCPGLIRQWENINPKPTRPIVYMEHGFEQTRYQYNAEVQPRQGEH